MARRKRQLFQFTTLEMLVVGAGYLVTSSLVFLLGVSLGKHGAASHEGAGANIARVPVDDSSRYAVNSNSSKAAAANPAVIAPPATSHGEVKSPRAAKQEVKNSSHNPSGGTAANSANASVPSAPRNPSVDKGGYSVQVLATRRRPDAEAMVTKLRAAGFDAYLREAGDGDDHWFRVRVGRYADSASARKVAESCRERLRLDQAFVSRY